VAGVARFSGLYSELCLWLEEADNGCRCRAEIEECEDADASKMQARPHFVPIDQLPSFIGKKARTTSVADMPLTSRGSTCCIGVAPTYKYCTPAYDCSTGRAAECLATDVLNKRSTCMP
jgi:hypothetical protein